MARWAQETHDGKVRIMLPDGSKHDLTRDQAVAYAIDLILASTPTNNRDLLAHWNSEQPGEQE